MADPILGLDELLPSDSNAYLRQNDRNLIAARLTVLPKAIANNVTYPSGTINRGDMWVVPASATSHWAGKAANTVAIALSLNPSSPGGWFFLTPDVGLRLWIAAGTGTTGHVVWNGSAYVAV